MLASAIAWILAAASPSMDGLAAVRSVLQRTEGATTCREDVLVRRLTALGPESASTLFGLVTGTSVEELLGDSEADAWLCPPDRVGALALETLANLPEVPVREAVRAYASAHPERGVRVAAFDVLGRQASAAGIPFYFELMSASADELEMRSVRAPAVEALAAILRTDAKASHALEAPLLAAPLDQQRLVCEALAASGRAEACGLLPKLVGRDPELDLVVLEGLAAFAERFPWRVSESTLALLRACLDHADPRLRAAGARALGRARDVKAVPPLVARLGDDDPDTAHTALWALRELTGQSLLTTREAWRAWLEGERTWWNDQGKAEADRLAEGDTAKLATALRDAQKHPLARAPIVDALLGALNGLAPEAKELACASLAQFGARRAVPALVELLSDDEPGVRAAAWNALRKLTGEDLPAEPQLWEDYANG